MKHRPIYREYGFSSLIQIFSPSLLSLLLPRSFIPATAFTIFTNTTLPLNLTSACSTALLSPINCSPVLPSLQSGDYYLVSVLNLACTATCSSDLATYEDSVLQACANEQWLGYEDTELPVVMIVDNMRYHYGLVCLKDEGRWCNSVGAIRAMQLDPDGLNPITGDKTPIIGDDGTPVNPCDLCFIKSLRMQAASPYYDGPLLADVYSSKTSTCSVTGYPLTTRTLGFYTPTDSPTPEPTSCSSRGGTEYTLTGAETETCHSVSLAEGISTYWLLADNALAAGCADFPTQAGTKLCLVNTCKVYTVQPGDTCDKIAQEQGISVPQLLAWNPSINAGCTNLTPKHISQQVCIRTPGRPFTPATSHPNPTPTSPTTPAPVPTDIADQTNTYCGRYYQAVVGDFCNMIVIKFGISLENFVFLNQAINSNCTNLFAEESYCVVPVGDINTYPGHPNSPLPGMPTSISVPATITNDVSTLPNADYTTPAPRVTEALFAPGSREDCARYVDGSEYQFDLTGFGFWSSMCDFVATLFGVGLEELGVWNPDLGNTTLSSCVLKPGVRYCGKYFSGDPVEPPEKQEDELPIRENTTPNCTEYLSVGQLDGWTCADILDEYSLTIAQFFKYNPDVQNDCSGLWLGYRYCVRDDQFVNPTSPATGVTPTPTPSSPLGPVQAGQPQNCNKWRVAVADVDNCATITTEYFITLGQFFTWNPAVSSDCSSGLWAGYAYCVGTTDTISSTRSESTPLPTPTPTPLPDPHQENNFISSCNTFAKALDQGDYCVAFAERNRVSLVDLGVWNQVLGEGGSNCPTGFWAGYWYCIGVVA